MNFKIQKYSQDYLFNNADSVEPEVVPSNDLDIGDANKSPDRLTDPDFLSSIKSQVGVSQPAQWWPDNEDDPVTGFTNMISYDSSGIDTSKELPMLGTGIIGELFASDGRVFVASSEDWKEVWSQEDLIAIAGPNTLELQE